MKILVSGGEGQLGKSLKAIAHVYPEYEFHFRNKEQLDLSSEQSIKTNLSESFQVFINAGAFTQVDNAEKEAEKCHAVNAKALEFIAKHLNPNCQVIHISTDYVYHSINNRPLKEDDPTEPQSVYAKSKLAGESILLLKIPEAIVLRTSWVYSPFGKNFVKSMVKLGRSADQLSIVADQIGTPTYGLDLANVIMDLIVLKITSRSKNSKNVKGIFNYSNEGQTNWADFASHIFNKKNIDCKVHKITTEKYNALAPRPKWSVLSKDKIKDLLEINIPHWTKSLDNCLDLID
ncbi:MAG: dTDP-4-dehydrorhamnose reductase [Saprospiraceae bacterium]|nr:dTDP-4-dehydrorhamnose reductase [Bacteroidia bacterium]NNE16276.1 dTDP-4-dehydrorhamnose reductase [Saprospiraceae bacterium]NNL91578.1 dTDP-4-dehydrorhamnose reductase [Saprospiraceae bacterium]